MFIKCQKQAGKYLRLCPAVWPLLLAGVVLTMSSVSQAQSAEASVSAQRGAPIGLEQGTGYRVTPIPDWVKPTPAFDPVLKNTGESSHGFHSRLHDFQYNGITLGATAYFNAIEYRLTNQYGVENYSSVEISFDPSYESLSLHELTIKRGDQTIDKLSSARFDLLRTERDRSELIYDGTRTLAIVLDDVRTNDIVRYSYTVDGENPVYLGNREFRVHTELWSAVDRQYTRVLTRSDKPLNRRVRGHNVPLMVTDKNGVQEIVMDQTEVGEFSIEDDVPSWYYNRGTVVFSDMSDWGSVVEWALPMYKLPEETPDEIVTIASVIRTSNEGEKAQVGAALRWVQEEIRYFGVELGKNSHLPSAPSETLTRRFGDCKDKALLLIALLRELGFEGQPALVNTNRGLEAANYPYRMHAFDHVIVHLQLEGETYFIDPTRRNQDGDLGDMYEPDYGRALVLSSESVGLTQMGDVRSKRLLSSTKSVTLAAATSNINGVYTEDHAAFEVVSNKRGLLAERLRGSLETDGIKGLDKDYVDYYREYFDGVVSMERPVVTDVAGPELQVTERYRIPAFWNSDENVDRYRWLYADEIIGYLDAPEEVYGRKQPYELIHPVVVEEVWNLSMPGKMRLDDLDAALANEWMAFTKESELSDDGRQLKVTFRYRTLSNEVAAEDLEAYEKSVQEIWDLASFYVEDEPVMGAAERITSGLTKKITRAGALSFGSLLIFALLVFSKLMLSSSPARRLSILDVS